MRWRSPHHPQAPDSLREPAPSLGGSPHAERSQRPWLEAVPNPAPDARRLMPNPSTKEPAPVTPRTHHHRPGRSGLPATSPAAVPPRQPRRASLPALALGLALALGATAPLQAQDRLQTMPGHEQFQRVAPQIPASVRSGALSVSWTDDGRAFLYRHEGRTYRYDVDARTAVEVEAAELDALRDAQRPQVERGRQFTTYASPDGSRIAVYRDHNIWITDADGGNERQLTTEGSAAE